MSLDQMLKEVETYSFEELTILLNAISAVQEKRRKAELSQDAVKSSTKEEEVSSLNNSN